MKYITVHFTKISAFQNEVYSKPLTYKNGLCLASGTNKTEISSMNITSNTNSPPNQVCHCPQWAVGGADEESSSAWTSCGAVGGVADAAAAANTSKGSVRAGGRGADPAGGGVVEG